MTTTIPVVIVRIGTYCNNRTISRKTNWATWKITKTFTSSFSINITTYLGPSPSNILIDTYMTTIISIPIIGISPYSYKGSISRKTDRWTRKITSSFSINITTYLSPSPSNILIDACMATTSSIAIIISSTNGDKGSISRKTDWITWSITTSFSINITTNF